MNSHSASNQPGVNPDDAPLRLEPGRNCCRSVQADRVALVVDGEDYYGGLRRSLIEARRRISIVAWDIHSRVELVRGDHRDDDGWPIVLGDLLVALLDARPELQVYILLWDWSPIYALEREPLFFGDGPWDAHERLHLLKDSAHPTGASHHQKIVVVDGRIAWCGGFDISRWRWDTSAHAADEPRRREPDGDPYAPFHDVQLLVDGDAAAALEAVVLDRWQWAGGEPFASTDAANVQAPSDGDNVPDSDPWPDALEPWLRQQRIGVARTVPEYDGRPAARESEQLYLDMIHGARRLIYIENHAVAAPEHHAQVRQRLLLGFGIVASFVVLALVWHLTPLGDWVDPAQLINAARELADSYLGPLLALAGFLVATVSGVPVTLVVVAAALVFGPLLGALIAVIGSSLAAIAGYEIGRWLGRTEIEHWAGSRLDRVKRRLSRRGALAIVAVRIAPVAPFSVLNLVAGATGWRRRDFLIGSLLGMLPAILLLAWVADWLTGYMERDDLRAIALVIGAGILLAGTVELASRIFTRGWRTGQRLRSARQSR